MGNQVLYRKYRPKKFKDVVSQEHVKTTLTNAVKNSRIGHAYLFTGPRGVGKTTVARILSRSINCINQKDGEPCNECEICSALLANSSLDLLEIDAASHTGVDNIREIIEHLKFSPSKASYKTIIVDEVHMLSKGAFNALLKTLEEPPKHAIFILATTEVHKVPSTIISRTQRFDFKKVGISELIAVMKTILAEQGTAASKGALLEIASAADGSLRDCLSILDQVISYSDGEINETLTEEVLGLTGTSTLAEFADYLVSKDSRAVSFISKLTYDGKDLFQFQKDFLEYLRKLLVLKTAGIEPLEYPDDIQAKLAEQALKVEQKDLICLIDLFQKAGSELKFTPILSLPLEIAAVKAISSNPPDQQQAGPNIETINENTARVSNSFADDAKPLNHNAYLKITGCWDRILEKIKEYNQSLISSLKLAQPAALQGGHLILVVPYKFHQDVIEARKNRIIIDQVIEDVSGIKVQAKAVLSKDYILSEGQAPPGNGSFELHPNEEGLNESNEQSSDQLGAALKIIGGEVEK
jgi:DNA polymerase III subunit gamma/tau